MSKTINHHAIQFECKTWRSFVYPRKKLDVCTFLKPLPNLNIHNKNSIVTIKKDHCSNDQENNNLYCVSKASCQKKGSPYDLECAHPHYTNEIECNKISVCSNNQCISFDNNAIECNKLARFIFPCQDPQVNPSWHIDKRSNSEKMYDILNLSLNYLGEHEYIFWNSLYGRNVKYIEKSLNGLYISDYDIKQAQICEHLLIFF